MIRKNKLNFVLLAGVAMLLFCFMPFAQASESALISGASLLKTMEGKNSPIVLDVRYATDYKRAHITGAVSVPYEKLEILNLPKTKSIVTYCSGIGCNLSNDAAIVLRRMGYKDVKVLEGGFAEWELKGYPVVRGEKPKTPVGTALLQGAEVTVGRAKAVMGKVQVVDVRPEVEFAAGHIPGALNLPLERLLDGVDGLGNEVLVVDRLPSRWKKAVQVLTAEGRFAHAVAGGMGAWVAMKNPLEAGAR
ncbi:MAG: rhodanese-like domain-containing protein [Armatimonadota bacterium]